ncbi:MAG: zf-TFIIB domain-containing protein [Candidatus Omnitrophica bacterium]|nr:zf-TFIIB domain-containing protein [Candidatus Omnitrophota bacterium]
MLLTECLKRTGQCPKCRTALTAHELERGIIKHCTICNGLWVNILAEKIALEIGPMAFSVDHLRRFRFVYKSCDWPRDTRYVPCPDCGQLMNRKIWGSHSGVIVDVCHHHGTWFDDGELEKVREYVRLGGIEYEKLQMMENGFSQFSLKLEHELRRLGGRPRRYSC